MGMERGSDMQQGMYLVGEGHVSGVELCTALTDSISNGKQSI